MSHLELITAVLIFIFAVGVVIYFTNVSTKAETTKVLLDALEAKLREKAEIDFNETLLFFSSISDGCYSLFLHSDLENEILTFIKTDNEAVAFNFFGDQFLIEKKEEKNLYRIYSFSVNVTEDSRLGNVECTHLTEGQDYNYSITYHGKIFTKVNLTQLEQAYLTDYKKLRKEFGLGNRDFAIRIKDVNISMVRVIPKQVEVQAREFPAKVILENGMIIETTINIQVW